MLICLLKILNANSTLIYWQLSQSTTNLQLRSYHCFATLRVLPDKIHRLPEWRLYRLLLMQSGYRDTCGDTPASA